MQSLNQTTALDAAAAAADCAQPPPAIVKRDLASADPLPRTSRPRSFVHRVWPSANSSFRSSFVPSSSRNSRHTGGPFCLREPPAAGGNASQPLPRRGWRAASERAIKERCSERACSPRILGFPLPPDAKSGYLPWCFIGHHTRGHRGSVSRAVSPSRYCRVLKGPGKEWAHLNPDFLRLRPPAACGFGFSNHACTPTNRTQSEV
jgi:hypothetical protein